jgi:V8-like Glu-specific endopeptidase
MTQEERTMVAERKKWIGVALAWTALVSLASCVEPPQGELLDEQGEKLLNGTPTFERPEVGRISGCTATLVRPNIVITAAHCVDFRSRTTPGNYNTFTIDLGPGNSSSYPVDLIQVYSSGQLGEQDVALMRLSRPVPAEIATPTTIADRAPASGEMATIFGYGCTNRSSQTGTWTKRKFEYSYGTSRNLCPGDSGGPVVLGSDGPVFGINSGYYTGGGEDIFGFPWEFKSTLEQQIEAWGGGPEASPTPTEVQVTNQTGARLWVRCGAGDRDGCTGWQLLQQGEATLISTFGRRLILDNRDFMPQRPLRYLKLTAPGDDVQVHANPANPFQAGQAPLACQPDAFEPNESKSYRLNRGTIQGTLCERDLDFFYVDVQGAWTVTMDFQHRAGDLELWAYDANGRPSLQSKTATNQERVSGNGPGYVLVYGFEGATGSYSLNLQ